MHPNRRQQAVASARASTWPPVFQSASTLPPLPLPRASPSASLPRICRRKSSSSELSYGALPSFSIPPNSLIASWTASRHGFEGRKRMVSPVRRVKRQSGTGWMNTSRTAGSFAPTAYAVGNREFSWKPPTGCTLRQNCTIRRFLHPQTSSAPFVAHPISRREACPSAFVQVAGNSHLMNYGRQSLGRWVDVHNKTGSAVLFTFGPSSSGGRRGWSPSRLWPRGTSRPSWPES